jgi:hypothetical protein
MSPSPIINAVLSFRYLPHAIKHFAKTGECIRVFLLLNNNARPVGSIDLREEDFNLRPSGSISGPS